MSIQQTDGDRPLRQVGRPLGAKNIDAGQIVEMSRCIKENCRSTERTPYRTTAVQKYEGMRNGEPFTHIVRRRTRCLACDQTRIDTSYEYRIAGTQYKEEGEEDDSIDEEKPI
jgi:hypothetical protein